MGTYQTRSLFATVLQSQDVLANDQQVSLKRGFGNQDILQLATKVLGQSGMRKHSSSVVVIHFWNEIAEKFSNSHYGLPTSLNTPEDKLILLAL